MLLVIFFCFQLFLTTCLSDGIFNVIDYGAKGDGKTNNTLVLQTVINDIEKAGGGTMYFPPNSGVYSSGSLWLCSNIIVSIGSGTTLMGSSNQSDFPWTYGRDGGTMTMIHASLINGGICEQMGDYNPNVGDQCTQWKKLVNVTISGGGIIDGNGVVWWNKTTDPRPCLLGLYWVDNLIIANLTVQNSPNWNVHPTFSNNIEIYNLNIYAPSNSPNTDGIDPDSCSNVYVHDCIIDVGDDCIAIKSGKDLNGRQVGIPTQNVLIERMQFKHGHGVSIGSEMSGDVRNVTIRNCNCSGTDNAVRIKTCRGRGGVVENIKYDTFTIPNVSEVVTINMYYCDNPPTNASATPIFRDIIVNNFNATQSTKAGEVMCLPESPCSNISLSNIFIKTFSQPYQCEYAYGTQTNMNPQSCLLPESFFKTVIPSSSNHSNLE